MVFAGHGRRVGLALGAAPVAAIALLVFLSGAASSAIAVPAGVAPRVSPAVTSLPAALTTSFADRSGFSASYLAEATDTGPVEGSVLVALTFVPRNASEFFATPAPGSPALTNSQLADRFGLSIVQYSGAEQYFRAEGLSIVHAWPDRLALTVAGPASRVAAAFGTSLRTGTYRSTPVTYPASDPMLPSGLEPLVGSVLGLSSGFDTFSAPVLPAANAGPDQGQSLVTPSIARQIYDLSRLYNVSGSFHPASGESIALLLWGYGYDPSDLSTFYSDYYPSSFPAPTLHAYPVDGAPPPSTNAVNDPCKASQELTLDLEWSGSMAPGATLDAVYAPESAAPGCSPTDASMADALNQAISLPVAAISMSFGTPDSTSGGLAAAWQTDIAAAVQKGITLVAATGDFGGDLDANCQGGPSPQYPSTSPDVLAVGGTDVALQYGALGGLTGFRETAWSQSGGGYSTQYGAPVWQSGFPSRGEPDVAATADDNFLYWGGQADQAGGTSFATPLWAGLITEMDALHGAPFGLIAPRLYAIGNEEDASGSRTPTGLAGITSGSNCIASAGPGWNEVTGWGSPRALNLYEDLTATFVNLSLTTRPSIVAQGSSVTISGHLANASSGAPLDNVPVQITLVASTSLGPCTGTFGAITISTDRDGNVSTSMQVPACYFGSHAEAELLVTSDGYYGTNSSSVPVNLFGLVPTLGVLTEFPYNVLTYFAILGIAATIGYLIGARVSSPRPPPPGPAPPPGARPPPTPPPASPPGETQSR